MEKRFVKKSFLLLILNLFFMLLVSVVYGDVIINEVMYAPNETSQGNDFYNQWIEIYNNGTSSIDLTNYTLCGKTLLKGYVNRSSGINLNTTFILNSSKYGLITDGNTGTEVYANFSVDSSALALRVDASSLCSGNKLSSSGDVLNLSNGTYTQLVNYTPFISLANGNGKTLIFYKGNWTESALENGTPGASNDQFAPDFNRWVKPSNNNSIIGSLLNITVNITDLVYSVNVSLINFNNSNFSMSKNGDLWYYLWNTSLNTETLYNITIFFNDTLGFSNTDTLFNITVDNTNPTITSGNLTGVNLRNFIFPGRKFNETVNVTDNKGIKNVTCYLNGTLVGYYQNITNVYYCELTAPSTESDYTITFTAIDKAGNTNTTAINFTTKHTTSASLTTQDITVSNLNQSNKTVEVNATLSNTGSSTIYNPNIILDGFPGNFAEATADRNKTCAANLSVGQSCSAAFSITVFGGKTAGAYTILWSANWTNNNFTYNQLTEATTSSVTINSNPQIIVTENRTATISHNTNKTLNISLNSSGNADLQNVNIAFTPSALQQSWVNINPSSFSSISAGSNKEFNVTITIPKYTSPGNYTGTLTISATSAESKSILLIIEVPEDSSWTSYPSNVTIYRKTDSAGLLGTIYINNTGNIGHRFDFAASGTLRFYIWNSSNPTSEYVEKGTTEAVNFYYKKALAQLNSYAATLSITSYNTSAVNITYFNLIRDDISPFINITNPINESYPTGLVEFKVNATDLNLSNILFYINNSLVFNDVNLTKTFNWNTTNGNYPDDIYTLKATAYDTAGNFNSSEINVTVNNTDDNPILISSIPAITWNEGNITNLTLSLYFKTIDGDSLKYNFTPVNNITIHVNNDTGIANFTPDVDFFGTRYIKFYAIDSSNNITASNNITLTVNNINDAPATPVLVSPANNANVISSTGKVTLRWDASTDADNDVVTYYVFLSRNSSNMSINTTTTNNYFEFNNLINNITYYWKIKATDNAVNSSETGIRQFTVITDTAPVIDSWQWDNTITTSSSNTTPRIQENRTLAFKVTASDADNNSINYTWYLNSTQLSTMQNYTFSFINNFTSAGLYNIALVVQDNNSNAVRQEWSLTVTDLNRQPTIIQIPDQAIVEDSVNNTPINLSKYFTDLDIDNTLTFFVQNQNTSKVSCSITSNNLTLMPAANFTGNGSNAANCSIVAYDGTINSSINSFRINVSNVNDAPVLTAIGSLTADQGNLFYYDVNATEVDPNDVLTFSSNSSLFNINSSTGEFRFTPTNAQVGTYKINITVKDASNEQDSKVITLIISNINDAPVLDTINDKSATEDSALIFNMTAYDPDGNSLNFTSNITSILFTNAVNNSLATVSWTPTNDYVGSNSVNITVSDGSLTDSQLATITVTNTNDAPTITSYYPTNLNPRIAANTGSQLFNVTPLDVDAGDVLTITWFRNNAQVGTGTSYTASGLSSGQYNITAKVNDTLGNATQQEWTLNVTTDIISGLYTGTILNFNITEENASDISINESAYGSIGFLESVNLSNAANIDDDIVIRQGVVSINANVLKGLNRSASIIMKGLNFTKAPLIYFNNGFNTVTGGSVCNPSTTPSCTNITYDTVNGILKFNVPRFSTYYTGTNTTNGAPEIISTPKTTARAKELYTYDVSAADPDRDTLTYSLTLAPSGMSISSSTGRITWTPENSQVGIHNVTVQVSDNNLTDAQSFNISVAEAKKLIIKGLDVKIDGKSDKNLANGDTIKREAKPESDIEFKIEVENGFTDEEELEIEDITVEITIRGIDDGDDIDEESKEFDLKPGKDKKATIEFKVPLEVDEDTYDVDIHVEGEDENGTTHEIDWQLYLEVEKEKHDIKIIKANLNPSLVKCEKTITLAIEIINLGREEENEVALEILNSNLEVNSRKNSIELEEGTEDNRYSTILSIKIPDNLAVGTYPITINSYYDTTKLSDTETVNLEVQECEAVKEEKEEVKVKPIVVVNETKPVVKKKEEVTKTTFRESPAYIAFLATSIVILTGLSVFAIGTAIVLLRKK